MTRVTKGLCISKNSDPKGLSAPAPGLYTCVETWKIMYKIRLQRYFFWNFQQMGKVTRLFCWHQDFVHKGLSAPDAGLYTCGKTLKNVYKVRIQRDLFETATNGQSDKGFLWTSKVCCPQRVFCPCPGAIYMCKIIKNVYKIRIWRHHFETCNIWAKRKGLSLVIKFLSYWFVSLCLGLYTCENKHTKKG